MCRPFRQFGFTLIELVMVMLVLAVCAAIAAPHLSGFVKGRGLPNAATDLVTTARWCRVQALSDGVEYRLNIDRMGGKWWVTKADDSAANFTNTTQELGQERTVPDGVRIADMQIQTLQAQGDVPYISFRAGGRTDVARITLANDSTSIVVACDTPLGSFHIVEGNTR